MYEFDFQHIRLFLQAIIDFKLKSQIKLLEDRKIWNRFGEISHKKGYVYLNPK